MILDRCALTGYELDKNEVRPLMGTIFEYENNIVGKVKITFSAYNQLINQSQRNFIIAGICKHRTILNQEPILIDSSFIESGYKLLNPPIEFEEKAYSTLKYLYENGGRQNHEFSFNSTRDFPLAYSEPTEFARIIEYLKDEGYVSIRTQQAMKGEVSIYMGVKMTKLGRQEIEKGQPKLPLFGLITQNISTGDIEIDKKINHARELFFSDSPSLDKMRSACETLSYIIEPLRKDLQSFFMAKDVNDFFQIVNNFDVRHNKEHTKNLNFPEQLEWVFYSLLNTINTYVKLKNRL